MATISERCRKLLEWAKGAAPELPTAVPIAVERVMGGAPPPTLATDQQYFKVVLNELYLAQERKWFTTWDPMALVVTEFLHAGEKTMLPFIVGRSTFEKTYGSELPSAMRFDNTHVAGWHPYKGGPIDLTVVLYRVKRDDHARAVLGLVERAANLFPFGTAIDLHLDVAQVVLDGVEAVLGLAETTAVFGRRHGLHPAVPSTIGSGYFALVDADVDGSELVVQNSELNFQGSGGGLEPFRKSDYLLYSVSADKRRDDVNALPFEALVRRALAEAQDPSEDARRRAKAAMTTANAAIVESHDVTWQHGSELREENLARLKEELARSQELAHLAAKQPPDPRKAAALLDAAKILDL